MVQFDVRQITEHITEFLGRFHERMYLVKGRERAALIDTGCGFGSLRAEVDRRNELPLIVLLTHGHQDHAMGAGEFEEVYLTPIDREVYERQKNPAYRLLGLSISRDAVNVTPEDMLTPPPFEFFKPVRAGDVFDLGDTSLEATLEDTTILYRPLFRGSDPIWAHALLRAVTPHCAGSKSASQGDAVHQ